MILALVLLLSSAPPVLRLSDQHEVEHDLAPLMAGPTVLIAGSERKTGEAIRDWLRLMPSRPGLRVLGLADLDAVPFFVPRSSIRSGLVELVPRASILCDYDGEVAEALGLTPGSSTAHVLYAGRIVARVAGPPSAAALPSPTARMRSHVRFAPCTRASAAASVASNSRMSRSA